MKTFKEFLEDCYYIQEEAGDRFASMSNTDFENYKKDNPSVAKFADKKRRDAQVRKTKQRFSNVKSRIGKVYQNTKDSVKQNLSKAYTTTPKDVVDAAKRTSQTAKDTFNKAAKNVYNTSAKDAVDAAKSKVSDVKSKLKYGRVIRPDTSGTSSLANTSSKLSKVSKASKALRVAGKVAGPAAAAIDVASEKSKGSGWARSLAKGAATAAGAAAGGTLGSAAGPVGTVAGSVGGATAASKAFDTVAGKNAKERAEDRVKNRQRQAGGALVGTGGKTSFDTKKNTMTTGGKTVKLANTSVVNHPKTGKQEAGHLAYKGGKAVYKRPDAPGTGTSNPLERIGRAVNPNAYKANDAKLAQQKLNVAKQNDATRNKALGIK
jgi:vacuolar-type H+-ATPase subunit H